MADIAFLLLIFFLVTTTIASDKGLDLRLPPHKQDQDIAKVHERNLFKIMINSNDELLIEGQPRSNLNSLRKEIQAFIINNGKDPESSDHPKDAVISIQTLRGTSQGKFIEVLDEVKASYHELYANKVRLSVPEFLALNLTIPDERAIYDRARKGIPMNISIAETIH